MPDTEHEMRDVAGSRVAYLHLHTRGVDPLSGAQGPASEHGTSGCFSGALLHPESYDPVGQVQDVALPHGLQELGIVHGDSRGVPEDIHRREREARALGEIHGAVPDLADADLRPRQVLQDGHRPPSAPRLMPDRADLLEVASLIAVGEVDPEDIHPCLHELPHHLWGTAGRTQRTDYLGLPHPASHDH